MNSRFHRNPLTHYKLVVIINILFTIYSLGKSHCKVIGWFNQYIVIIKNKFKYYHFIISQIHRAIVIKIILY